MRKHDEHIFSKENQFIFKDTDLSMLHGRPFVSHGVAVMLCTNGNATVTVDAKQYELHPDMQLIMLPDSTLSLDRAGDGFRVLFCYFSRRILDDATFRIDPEFLLHLSTSPVYRHSPTSIGFATDTLSLLSTVYADELNASRTEMATNLLRNIFLNACDKLKRKYGKTGTAEYGRKEDLFGRFINLIIGNSARHRNVEFYADRLCISKRYLAAITRQITGDTPKETIDMHVVQEIKMALAFSDLSLGQLAERFGFPDQSYMGRYFKRYTGFSLSEYRRSF